MRGERAQYHRDQLGQISLLQGEIKLLMCALTMFWHQGQDHGGPLPQCVHKAGLVHPFLDRSILATKFSPSLLDSKASIGSTVIFWPQSPPWGSLTPSQRRSQVVFMLEMNPMTEEFCAKPGQRQEIGQEITQ